MINLDAVEPAFGDAVRALVAELRAARAAQQWQPIETAPKGGFPLINEACGEQRLRGDLGAGRKRT